MTRTTSKSSLGFKSRQLSVTFQHNARQYKRFTSEMKKRVRDRFAVAMGDFADNVVNLAKMMCPIYEGALEEAITMTDPYGFGGASGKGRVAVQIGVLSSWKSEYDKLNPPWGHSSKEIVYILHEYWEEVAGDRARKRAAAKSAITGERVGSHFLTRATNEVSRDFSKYLHSGKLFEGLTGVNAALSKANKYVGKWRRSDLMKMYSERYDDE